MTTASEKRNAKQADGRKPPKLNAFWWKQVVSWHWISSAVSLAALLLFAATGITLNHAADIERAPVVVDRQATLPPALLRMIASRPGATDEKRPLPPPVGAWVSRTLGQSGRGVAEWSEAEIYLPLPRPGGDGWVSIDRATGAATAEVTDRGWIAWLNDLHKGRNAGPLWGAFIDLVAVACCIFALTGLVLLWLHSAKRRITWPLVTAGLIVPALVALLFAHP